ncbi:antitoxin [Nostocoides sp. F2B08]|uniref:antitoxin n=1 Tax=Nostocoides sp. F2B08 TaxID=2653936 RepID=UPI001262C59B|nr:antitoxin [Tetrasphaera sp. F2B08]KAB7744775.1 antitoxin [Tetrasphaera sp. F2B08]
MGVFDKMKKKAEDLTGQHSDKVEQYSDQGLDMAADRANTATGGKHADHIDTARTAADDRIGDEGAAADKDVPPQP